MSITVGQKVKIIHNDNTYTYGTITHVYPPCDFHSGRFTVLMHDRYMSSLQEFWYSDYGKTVTDSK